MALDVRGFSFLANDGILVQKTALVMFISIQNSKCDSFYPIFTILSHFFISLYLCMWLSDDPEHNTSPVHTHLILPCLSFSRSYCSSNTFQTSFFSLQGPEWCDLALRFRRASHCSPTHPPPVLVTFLFLIPAKHFPIRLCTRILFAQSAWLAYAQPSGLSSNITATKESLVIISIANCNCRFYWYTLLIYFLSPWLQCKIHGSREQA